MIVGLLIRILVVGIIYWFFLLISLWCWVTSGQHVELHNPNPPPHCVGYIHTKMSPVEVARHASEDARSVCLREYGSAPDITIYGDPDFTFP